MPSLSVNSFELHWDVLTTKQRKSLLAQLDSFVAGRAIVRKHATKNVAPLLEEQKRCEGEIDSRIPFKKGQLLVGTLRLERVRHRRVSSFAAKSGK